MSVVTRPLNAAPTGRRCVEDGTRGSRCGLRSPLRITSVALLWVCVTSLSSCVEGPETSSSGALPVGAVWPDEGPRTWAPRPTTADITANDLRTRLYQIADDSMLGRRMGEPGNYLTTAYIAAEFQRLGLRPAGEGGTYFQDLPYGPIGFDLAQSRLAIGDEPLEVKSDWVPIVPAGRGGMGGAVSFDGVATVFAGRWGDAARLDPRVFRGKVAVFLTAPGAPGGAAPARPLPEMQRCDSLPDRFGAAAAAIADAAGGGNVRVVPGPGDTRAMDVGVAGVLIVGLDEMSPEARDATFATRMTMEPSPTSGSTTLSGATISADAARRLFGRAVEQLRVGTTGAPVTGTLSYAWHQSETPGRNVIAVLPGSDPTLAGEYVLVGAHNDHNGVRPEAVDHDSLRAVNMVTRRQGANDPACRPTAGQQQRIDSLIARARSIRPPRRDSIMNGADDDGSGTVVLLEIAEKFAAEKPARSIIFISHEGEEAGLLGSRWFVDHPTLPLESIVAAHNMDMVGKGRADQVKFGGPTSVQTLGARRFSREFGDIIDSVNAVRDETMAIDKSWDVTANPMNRFCRSDQVNYVHKDIPVTYFSLGYAEDYHQPTDEPQYVEYDHAARVGRFVHDIMWAVATRPNRPAIAGLDPAYPACR